jgi:hypothetical protein
MKVMQELNEARAFRSVGQIEHLGADKAARVCFLHILVLHLLSHEDSTLAADYARKTLNYTDFTRVLSGNTDLYNLITGLMNAEKYLDHKDYLIPEFNLKRYLRYISSRHKDASFYRQFLLKLQTELKLQDTKLNQFRRAVVDWDSSYEQEYVAKQLYRALVNSSYNGDLFGPYREFLRKKHWLGDFFDVSV